MSDISKIEIRGLRKSFGDNEVLKNINLDVPKGGVVALIGPSGSGKSTLLRCINLLVVPDGGSVRVGDTSFSFGDGSTLPKSEVTVTRRPAGLFSPTARIVTSDVSKPNPWIHLRAVDTSS